MADDPKPTLLPFMVCGMFRSPKAVSLFEQKVNCLGISMQTVPLDGSGAVLFSIPPYADIASNYDMLGVKLGYIHEGEKHLSMSDVLFRGLATPFEVQHQSVHGNGILICFSKREPHLCAYKTLLAVPGLYYCASEEGVIITNNLGVMVRLIDKPELNPYALPLHFLYRSMPGPQTYISNVIRLGSGEMLQWHDGILNVVLCKSLRGLCDENTLQSVEPQIIGHFYEQFKGVVDFCLDKVSTLGGTSATLLSGGVDSSLMQLAINDHLSSLSSHSRSRSFSYTLDAPCFAPEINYARTATRLFDTDHTFINIASTDYLNLMIESTDILGQPLSHESVPCVVAVVKYIAEHHQKIDFLFCGGGADGLHGIPMASELYRAEKYKHWPIFLLKFLGKTLAPIWQSKAYGARQMADLIPELDNLDSPHHPMNALAMYTDWQLLNRCFESHEIYEALAYRRALEERYLNTSILMEKVQVLDMYSDVCDTTGLWYQLGLAYLEEIFFPYLDDVLLTTTFAITPHERYYFGDRTKPILKMVLEEKGISEITNNPKFGSGFSEDLFCWMSQGLLRDRLQAIERPPFMSKADFNRKLEQPDWFTWNLLTLDIFQKEILTKSPHYTLSMN